MKSSHCKFVCFQKYFLDIPQNQYRLFHFFEQRDLLNAPLTSSNTLGLIKISFYFFLIEFHIILILFGNGIIIFPLNPELRRSLTISFSKFQAKSKMFFSLPF